MGILIETFAAGCLSNALSTLFGAVVAPFLGGTVAEICIGFGPVIASIGRVKLRLLPVAGSVKLMNVERAETSADRLRAFEFQPRWKHVAFQLSGSAFLVVCVLLVAGEEGFAAFRRGFGQILIGAVRPFSAAQTYLGDYAVYAESHGALDTWTLVAAKVAAWNLLPFPPFSGGMALLFLFERRPMSSSARTFPLWIIIPPAIIWVGWTLALGCAAWRAAW